MSTVIYLSNQNVQIVTGTQSGAGVSLKNFFNLETPEGSTINGMIMNAEAFVAFMKEEWKKNNLPTKDVILVVNSSKFAGKVIEMPSMGAKKTRKFISGEYADIGRNEGSIYSSIAIGKGEGKLKRIYAEAIEPDFINEYIETFNEIGIKLSAIYSAESTLIRFVEKTAAARCDTFLFIVVTANTFTVILWINGGFYHYSLSRCFQTPGTVEFAEDLGRTISQMNQFLQAHQIEHHFKKIFISGVEDEDLKYYITVFEEMGIHTPVEGFKFGAGSSPVVVQSMIQCVSGLYKQDKTENFLPLCIEAIKKGTGDSAESPMKTIAIASIGGTLVLMLLVYTVCAVINKQKQSELDAIVEYNNQPARLLELARYDEITYRNSFLNAQFNAIDGLEQNLVTYPTGNTEVMNVFYDCAGDIATLSFGNFNAEEGYISVVAQASVVEDINAFIKKLTEQKIFTKVDYTGYTYQEDTGLWNIMVSCTLAESAGKEN